MSGSAVEDSAAQQPAPTVMSQPQINGTTPSPTKEADPLLTNGKPSDDSVAIPKTSNDPLVSTGAAMPSLAATSSATPIIPGNGVNIEAAGKQNGQGHAISKARQVESEMQAGSNTTVRSTDSTATARGRGRGGSKSRGRGRAATKGRKRKREDGTQDDEQSDDSEVCTPSARTTKSGRSVQRPTSFVPPLVASPTTVGVVKKKRVWRRNPENAVCKLCLRGVSPNSNQIVFCDGCNTPYHRWCHHPPIDQSVIDETDKEWFCRQCRRDRIVPVAEADVAHFVSAAGASPEERQKFFSNLTPGALVTLLTRITTLSPNLPLFDPAFAARHSQTSTTFAPIADKDSSHPTLGASTNSNSAQASGTIFVIHDDDDEDEGYGPEEHPAHYVRPGKGLMSTLPPDKDDETYLVDEQSSKNVFHHIYIVDEKAANQSVNGVVA